MTESVQVLVENGIAELALASPPLNLMTVSMIHELQEALEDISGRSDVLAVIIHGGESRAFCAGSDMAEFGRIYATAAQTKILPEDHLLKTLAEVAVPTIAAVDGPALGGGFELALACDLRILHPEATVGLTETRIGGLASSGAVRLTRLVGPGLATELLVTGRVMSAENGRAHV